MTDSNRRIRVTRLADQGKDDDLNDTTPEQRLAMMWQITLDAWAFKGEGVQGPMQRHVVRVLRGWDEINAAD